MKDGINNSNTRFFEELADLSVLETTGKWNTQNQVSRHQIMLLSDRVVILAMLQLVSLTEEVQKPQKLLKDIVALKLFSAEFPSVDAELRSRILA